MADAPFLLLSIRGEGEAARDEYRSVLRFGGLDGHQLHRVSLTEQQLGHVDLSRWSGIVLGGGPFTVSDDPATKTPVQRRVENELAGLLEAVVARDFPFLGCCYGVGTLGTAVGAVIDRLHSEAVGPVTVDVTAHGDADPLFAGLPRTFAAYGGHKESASVLPDGVVCLATSAACPVQAFRVGENVYATQFHPELDLSGLLTRIDAYKNHGYFPPETAQTLKDAARQVTVTHPMTVLHRFTRRYAR